MSLALSKARLGLLVVALTCGASFSAARVLQEQNPEEVTSRTNPITFKTGAKEVLVRVVVRDNKGNAVGTLNRDDFSVFDKSAQQKIVSFRVEMPEARMPGAPKTSPAEAPATVGAIIPDHFIGYLFDDIHIDFGDLSRVREAAIRHMVENLRPGDRAAIFTTSGQVTQDFTADVDLLRSALNRIQPRPVAEDGTLKCPWMSFYMADLIVTHNDTKAFGVATDDLMNCESIAPQFRTEAEHEVMMKAHEMMAEGNRATRMAVVTFKDIVQRMTTVPGHRVLVLASPGFLVTDDYRPDVQAAIDRAVRSNVIVGTLDVQGLWVDAANEAAKNSRSNLSYRQYIHDSQINDRDVLGQIADGTGGDFFHNSNDLAEGFRRTAATPEYSYVITFAPQNLKSDGSYHPLKVQIAKPRGLTITARRGYYAPNRVTDPEEVAKQDIEDAVFSREELAGIPIDLRTQFFKTSDYDASVAVLARVHVDGLQFKKQDGRNVDNLTIVAAVFDRNGQYVTGQEKLVELHMHDAFIETVARTAHRDPLELRSEVRRIPGARRGAR